MILNRKLFDINSILLINLVFSFFPISFILGSLITNINLILFCCLGIFHLRSKILTTEFNLSIKIIFLFFLAIFFSTCLSLLRSLYLHEYEHYDLIKLIKSILFFRFFLMLVVIYLLSKFDILNFKYFFLSVAFITLLVSLDIIYQYFFGSNLLGLKSLGQHNSGFFGDELIAGGFIKNFSFFSIFFVAFSLRSRKNFMFILVTLVICILGVGIMFSGNKMPLISFLFGLFLIFLFNNKLKKILLASLLILFSIFGIIFSFDDKIKINYSSYYKDAYNILLIYPRYILKNIELPFNESKTIPQKIQEESGDTKFTAIDEKLNPWQGLSPWLRYQGYRNPPVWKGEDLEDDFEFFWVVQQEVDTTKKIYLSAIDIWKKNKIFGNGIKSFRQDCKKLSRHKIDRLCSNHPHNYYLEILTETGILGFSIILVMGLLFALFIIKKFKFLNDNTLENLFLFAATISLILEAFPIKSTGSVFTTNNATYLILIASIIVSHKKLLSSQNSTLANRKNV